MIEEVYVLTAFMDEVTRLGLLKMLLIGCPLIVEMLLSRSL